MRNGEYWSHVFRGEFIPVIAFFCENLAKRIIPSFDSIEKEAEEFSQEKWAKFCKSYSLNIDPADFSEQCLYAGIDRYAMLEGVKQTFVNMSAVTLHHLWEQQIVYFFSGQDSRSTEVGLCPVDPRCRPLGHQAIGRGHGDRSVNRF